MKTRHVLLLAFAVLCFYQIYIPAKMVLDKETVINEGKTFRFKCKPIDPTDPFRGKYIVLRFEQDRFESDAQLAVEKDQLIYVSLETDSAGFAQVVDVTTEKPIDDIDFIIANCGYTTFSNNNIVNKGNGHSSYLKIEYPFDRYYMSENKALAAEQAYRDVNRSEKIDAYALVKIENGKSVLEDVYLDEIPIKDYIDSNIE